MVLASAALVAGVSVGLALGGSARAEPSDPVEAASSSQAAASWQKKVTDAQARLADATAKLEDLFADQFVKGAIDRPALASAVDEAVQAFSQEAQARVRKHIEEMITEGQQLAAQMSPEERAVVADPPEQLGTADDAILAGWGWGRRRGFGGYGAFAFPGMFRLGRPYAPGFGAFHGRTVDCAPGIAGCRLGRGGWFW
jgi:hypothetical protein